MKTKQIKARRMWRGICEGYKDPNRRCAIYRNRSHAKCTFQHVVPVAVLDVSDEDALVEQVATALYNRDNNVELKKLSFLHPVTQSAFRSKARAVLESLNIIAKRRVRR